MPPVAESLELRDREEARAWIAGGLSLSRLAASREAKTVGAAWLIESVSETGRLLPAGMVLDLGQLFSGCPLKRSIPLPAVQPELRAALRSYEDHVLGRLEASPVLDAMIDAFAPLKSRQRARAVGVLTASLVERLGLSAVAVSPGVLRSVVASSAAELEVAATEALEVGSAAGEQLLAGYREVTARAHRAAKLLTDADVFVVSNIDVLADLTQRLAVAEILDASAERRESLPRRIKARRRPKKRHVTTSLADEDHYPTGGFSSIATSGSMENLVISELIYMEDASASDQSDPPEVDLFDLRYAEGELLYYTRDESQFVRDHRAIGFALSAELTAARVKERGDSRQAIIEVFGLIHAAVARLSDWLSEHSLEIAIRTIDDNGRDALSAERGLLEVVFAEEIERGLVSVDRAASTTTALAESIGDPRAEPEWVLIGMRGCPEERDEPVVGSIRLDGSLTFVAGSSEVRTLKGWNDAALVTLQRLV